MSTQNVKEKTAACRAEMVSPCANFTESELLFDALRPAILNGIADVITPPDLADRTIFLALRHVKVPCL